MSGEARILVVDDEPQVHRFLQPALAAAGYAPERADTAAAALRTVATRAPAAVLLDLGLPDMDGHAALRELRRFSTVPVIILSARDRETDKIEALDNGADDYVEKPFAVGELLARIRTALRHHGLREAPAREVIRLPGLEIDLARRQARGPDGAELRLSRREWEVLAALARNAGRVMTHQQLLAAVWGPAHLEDVAYLRVYVGQLRQKLGAASHLIRNEPGVGYRLLEEPEA